MSSQPTVESRAPKHYVGIPVKVSLREWYRANALVPEIYQWLAEHDVVPTGGPIYRYHTIGDDDREFDLEVCVPVANPVQAAGRVHAGIVPAGRYAVMVHEGHPDKQHRSHAALQEWAAARNLVLDKTGDGHDEVWAARCESYLTNPEEQPDPDKWSTEIAYLLKETP